ncbi:hypothetical protein GMRT_13563 [Giardia muris]|uniref:Uncharacterized protein n=1 Tax=Giardia muris TaxID=5742 RepID=A0A4Z1T7C7_GIAMU|nr:hypothetical protein GMRT_13563 [Giardia muris]|eukprot:TNJ29983.1 hypothetical protein GMRT_13563 [Giardia muris]
MSEDQLDDLERRFRESEALVSYLRTVIDSKDERIAHLEQEMKLAESSHAEALLNIGELHDVAIVNLKNEIKSLQDVIDRSNRDLESLHIASRENSLLRAQIVRLKNDVTIEQQLHQDELQEMKTEMGRVRATLANEFHTQLENVVREKTTEHLMALPAKAREALAEREILRHQLEMQDKKLFEACSETIRLQGELRNRDFEMTNLKEELTQFSKANALYNKRVADANKRIREVLDENSDLRGQNAAFQITGRQLKDAQETIGDLKTKINTLTTQNKLLLSGLTKACQRLSAPLELFYVDPFADDMTDLETSSEGPPGPISQQVRPKGKGLSSTKSSGYGAGMIKIARPKELPRGSSGKLRKADGTLRFVLPDI